MLTFCFQNLSTGVVASTELWCARLLGPTCARSCLLCRLKTPPNLPSRLLYISSKYGSKSKTRSNKPTSPLDVHSVSTLTVY